MTTRCTALTKNGKQCRQKLKNGSRCYHHRLSSCIEAEISHERNNMKFPLQDQPSHNLPTVKKIRIMIRSNATTSIISKTKPTLVFPIHQLYLTQQYDQLDNALRDPTIDPNCVDSSGRNLFYYLTSSKVSWEYRQRYLRLLTSRNDFQFPSRLEWWLLGTPNDSNRWDYLYEIIQHPRLNVNQLIIDSSLTISQYLLSNLKHASEPLYRVIRRLMSRDDLDLSIINYISDPWF